MAQRIVGLDIGTSAVRAVELTLESGRRPVLEAFGQVGLHPGAVVDGEIHDRSQVVQAVQRVWREGGFRERRVILGIAGLRAITREVDMPPLKPDELDEAVRFQADQVVPFPMDETVLSSKVIAQYTDADGTPQIRVLVAAAHRELIDGVVAAVRDAGLEPVGIDLDTAALARALREPGFAGGAEINVSVGAGLTLVVVHEGGLLQFVRTIDMGGESVTKSIAGALDVPLVDAEQIKRKLTAAGNHEPRALSAADKAVSELVGEIHNSVRFYSSQPGRTAPSRMLVTGGGALTIGLVEQLRDGIDIPVFVASPLAQVDTRRLPISPDQQAAIDPTLAVPIGLALPDPGEKPFNLLPPEVTAAYAERRVLKGLLIAAAVVLLLVVVGSVWRVLSVHHAESQVSTLNKQLAYINNVQIPKYDKVVSLQTQVRSLQAQDKPLVAKEVDWLVVFNQLSQYLPSDAVFTTVSLKASSTTTHSTSSASNKRSTIASGTATVVVSSYTGFSQFGNSMSQSPAITLGAPSGSLTNGKTISFTIDLGIGSGAGSQRTSLFEQPVP